MDISLNLLKPKNFTAIFILCHVISFFSIFIPYSSGAIVSGILIVILIVHFKLFIKELFERENILFCLLIFFEILSFIYYLIIPETRSFFLQHPSIVLQAFSYLFLPQIAFYFFGYHTGKNSIQLAIGLKVIVGVCLVFGVMSLYFHFMRPGFFTTFIDRTIMVEGGYIGFYPRLTGYLNSMIVGILCSSCLILSIHYISHKGLRAVSIIVFSLCIIFSLQRGAWASMVIGILFYVGFSFAQRPITTFYKTVKFILIGVVLFFLVAYGLSFTQFDIFGNEMFETIAVDMVNKIDSFSEAASERGYQQDSFTELIKKYPLGVGYGLLSHKSADMGFQYAIPDGNYYRLGGEIGVFGLFAFLLLLIIAFVKLYAKKAYAILIALLLFALQAYGTNVFDLYMCGFLFWYILGASYSLKSDVGN